MKVSFIYPGLPESMNVIQRKYRHYHARNNYYKKIYQTVAYLCVKQIPETPFTKAKLNLIRLNYRTLDYDGLVASMKPIVDGLKHAGVILDDRWSVTGVWNVSQEYCPKGSECVWVNVEKQV